MNRIIAVVASVVVLAGAVIVLLVTAGAVSSGFVSIDWLEIPLERASEASGGSLAVIIVVSVILLALALLVLVLEFSSRGRQDLLLISSGEEGSASVDEGSVRLLAERAASGVSGVREVQCWVRERSSGLSISCRALTVMGSNVPELSDEIHKQIKETVSQYTGLPVADVKVTVRYEKAEGKRVMVR